jgi:hypothetical protein
MNRWRERESGWESGGTQARILHRDGGMARWEEMVHVLECLDHLHQLALGFLLRDGAILFDLEIKIVAITVLHHCAERVVVDLEYIIPALHCKHGQALFDNTDQTATTDE